MTDSFEDHDWADVIDAETLGIYSAYKRDLYVGERPAVLVVDAYKLSYDGGAAPVAEVVKTYPSSCGERAWAMVEPTRLLLETAREVGLAVIYSTHDGQSRSAETPTTNRSVNRTAADSFTLSRRMACS